MAIVEERERVLDSGRLPYEAPAVDTLGTLGDLTRGAGPGNMPIVAQSGGSIPGFMTPPKA